MDRIKTTTATLSSLICLYLATGDVSAATLDNVTSEKNPSITQESVIAHNALELDKKVSNVQASTTNNSPINQNLAPTKANEDNNGKASVFNTDKGNNSEEKIENNSLTKSDNKIPLDRAALDPYGCYALPSGGLPDEDLFDFSNNATSQSDTGTSETQDVNKSIQDTSLENNSKPNEKNESDNQKSLDSEKLFYMDSDKDSLSLSDDELLRMNAEKEMSDYIRGNIGYSALSLLVYKLKRQEQYTYDEKVDKLIGYGAAVNKSDLPQTTKDELIAMMCRIFESERNKEIKKIKKADRKTASANQNKKNELVLKASNVEIKANGGVKEAEVRRLLPELKREKVRIAKLSKNIQMINDTGTMKLKAQLQPEDDGSYRFIILADDKKDSQFAVSASDTGNSNSGNWRTSFSYTNTDLTKNVDMLNLSYTTSPNNYKNVHQSSIFYKWMFPESGDSAYINYSFSNVDMGNVATIYGLDLYTTGESKNFGVHYQHNFKYTSAQKQILDFGYDYKMASGDHKLKYGDSVWVTGGYDVAEKVFSTTYSYSIRRNNDSFSYNLGYCQNIDGSKDAYNNYRTGSDDIFHIFKAGLNYQYRTASDWVIGARLNGQYTTDNLLSTEQLATGGLNGVRGFKESIANGDRGFKGSIEVYSPAIAKNHRIALFTDFANLSNNTYNIGESRKNLASIGLGYRLMGLDGWSVSLDYAKPVSSAGVSDTYHKPWHVSITKTF